MESRLIQELYLYFGKVVSLFLIPSCVYGGINSFLFHMGVTQFLIFSEPQR